MSRNPSPRRTRSGKLLEKENNIEVEREIVPEVVRSDLSLNMEDRDNTEEDDVVNISDSEEESVIVADETPGEVNEVVLDVTDDTNGGDHDDSVIDLTGVEAGGSSPTQTPPVRGTRPQQQGPKKKTLSTIEQVVDLTDSPCTSTNMSCRKTDSSSPPPSVCLQCPVCLDSLLGLAGDRHALSTKCGHLFCSLCIPKIIAASNQCPTCRKTLIITDTIKIFL